MAANANIALVANGLLGIAMDFALSVRTQERVEEKLKTGLFKSADDLVLAALDALERQEVGELDEATLDAIDASEDQFERGEFHRWEDVRERILEKFKKKS